MASRVFEIVFTYFETCEFNNLESTPNKKHLKQSNKQNKTKLDILQLCTNVELFRHNFSNYSTEYDSLFVFKEVMRYQACLKKNLDYTTFC